MTLNEMKYMITAGNTYIITRVCPLHSYSGVVGVVTNTEDLLKCLNVAFSATDYGTTLEAMVSTGYFNITEIEINEPTRELFWL